MTHFFNQEFLVLTDKGKFTESAENPTIVLADSRFLDVIFQHIKTFLGISDAADLLYFVDVNAGIDLGLALERSLNL
jgi:hypothetical protein